MKSNEVAHQNPQLRPRYDELGADGDCPSGAAWSVYGDGDQLGSIGLLTAGCVLRGAELVKKGAVFSLNWSLDLPDPALFGRRRLSHLVRFDEVGADDSYDDFFPQCSTQWDSLGHISHPRHGYYQGHRERDIGTGPSPQLGIEHWARRGIAGRFVLADVEKYRRETGRPLRQDRSDEITVDDIEACLSRQKSVLHPGDILLLRTGWIGWYEKADLEIRTALAHGDDFSACGLSRSEESARWIWENALAAVAADNPALEVQPFRIHEEDGFLHYRLIPLLGLAIGEMFALDELAKDSSADGRYEGLFVSAPLNKTGGVGSPANALALK